MKYLKGLIGCTFFVVFVLVSVWPASDATAQAAKEVVVGYTGPISGVAAEYGQDCVNGIEMAINEINAAGGITVKGQKYLFNLVKLDDMIDPTQAVNNCRRLRDQYKAPAVFNPVFNTLAAMAKINEERGNEFLIMAYTSTPKVIEIGNKLLAAIPPPFTVYVKSFADIALAKGWRKAAMVVTLGAYGDEWRHAFKEYWEKKGGQILADKPANYYTETDFSAPLTAALATKPQVLLIGGPSASTALVIEQARGLGFKGGFILIDQAKMDYIENILKGTKLMGNLIGVAAVALSPTVTAPIWEKKYRSIYKRMSTWEVSLNYDAMYALSRAMSAAEAVEDSVKIRAAFPKAFPLTGDKFPVEYWGITPGGRMEIAGSVQVIDQSGKYGPVQLVVWWYKTKKEFDQFTKTQPPLTGNATWSFFKFEKDE
ncbi:MAG TPA: ABC transporter substrate-binding protein [Thermodesulfobacteriota bacterium]|nr:ABC transporter substrate-binding protein [Thermodesulfobacteriota bacterium]